LFHHVNTLTLYEQFLDITSGIVTVLGTTRPCPMLFMQTKDLVY